MLRLLIVLVVVLLAAWMLNSRDEAKPVAESPQATYQRETGKAQAMEQQMQDQVDRQLEQIDAATPK